MRLYNWLLKQVFYLKYLILKQGSNCVKELICQSIETPTPFYSNFFTDGQWNKFLPWHSPEWPFQDWNTYGIFKQMYGKFYFKAKLEPYLIRQPYFSDIWSAIWLLDMANQKEIDKRKSDHKYYYEVDIELLKNDLSYTIHWNHTGKQDKTDPNYHWISSKFGSHKLYRNLQKDFHLFLIDWNKDWIKFYVNGLLMAKFRNEIHVPMQIVISRTNMTKTIVQK